METQNKTKLEAKSLIKPLLLFLSGMYIGYSYMYSMMTQNSNILIQAENRNTLYSLPSNLSESLIYKSDTVPFNFKKVRTRKIITKRNKKWTQQIQSIINNSKSIQNMSAVIIIFVRYKNIINFIHHLNGTLLQTKCMYWISKYPLYIVSNDMNDPLLNNQINQTIYHSLHANNLRIIDITKYWKLSKHYLSSIDTAPSLTSTFGSKYRIMCSVWGSLIFDIPEISKFDYYMRLDDDSYLNCNCDTTLNNQCETFDPFVYMRKNNFIYGYWMTVLEVPSASQYFIPFMHSYMSRNMLRMHIQSNVIGGNSTDVDTFYNNWEIGYIPYFKSDAVRHFSKSVLESNGYFLYRWGDAIIRYFQIGLWLDKKYIWCMFDNGIDNYFNYKHWKHKLSNQCINHL